MRGQELAFVLLKESDGLVFEIFKNHVEEETNKYWEKDLAQLSFNFIETQVDKIL